MNTARCALCGRLLRDQASRVHGVGPVCARRSQSHSRPPVSRLRRTPLPDLPSPGQAELPLDPQQSTLWSP
ncbi:DUF6011 domain-containing protein [Streptomyces sp. AV19]|uniref:DUF6011 domain-containing protein n=1 Tax=Streptomyces sp. AV19 TaxID=2793068 RepID=UPI0024137C38|nr:DUF6011 domain-containing protein [Streptomyces sp. AV19]MDG4531649.1 DUF6011 domain-containing protein [Streptomyces sp. AV19]